jgi:hypothetical protein
MWVVALLATLLPTAPAQAGDLVESVPPAAHSIVEIPMRRAPAVDVRLWRSSVIALAAANALDIHSSWGKHELNRALASADGTFGARGTAVKLGFQGGLMGLEYLLVRRRSSPRLLKALTVVNFAAGSVIASTALHNYTIPRVRP